MSTSLRYFWLLCFGFGCAEAGGDSLQAQAASGSRLIARSVVSEGGAARFLHFVDRQTQEPCTFSLAERDGEPGAYCLPAQFGQLVFADDACTVPLIQTGVLEHEWVTSTDPHGTTEPVGFRLGSQVPGRRPLFYSYANSDCTEWEVPTMDLPVYEVAEQRGLEAWGGGALSTKKLSRQLEVVAFEGDDGSRVVWDLRDTKSGAQCRPGETESGVRCAPFIDVLPLTDEGLRSSDCERAYVAEYNRHVVARMGDTDNDVVLLKELDRDTSVSRLVDGECVAQPSFQPGRKTLYAVESYPSSQWPQMELTRAGAPALQTEIATAQGQGANAFQGQNNLALFDAAGSSEPCGPSWINGSLRCVPNYGEHEQWFYRLYADRDCQVAGVSVREGMPAPRVTRMTSGVASPEMGSLPEVEIFEVGAFLGTEAFQKSGNGGCRSGPMFGDLYEVGSQLSAADFEPLELLDE